MTPAELLWRVSNSVRDTFAYAEMIGRPWLARQGHVRRACANGPYPIGSGGRGNACESIRIFDRTFPPDFSFNWHCDYSSNRHVPARFAPALDIRDPNVVGDVKYIWEVNRHQHLSAMAFSGHPQAGRRIAAAIKSWLAANPYLVGINWTSSLEIALRLISWTLLYPAIAEDLAADGPFRQAFEQSVFLHMRHIRSNLSRFSSANNHLLGELVGLFCGSICFPWWDECRDWCAFAQDLLEQETLAQFARDGINREQAFSYQLFTLELLLFFVTVGRAAGATCSKTSLDRLRAAVHFVESVATVNGELPFYGDSDDARGFLVSPEDAPLDVVLELGGRLFAEPSFLDAVSGPTAAARALLSLSSSDPGLPRSRKPPAGDRCLVFRDGGMAVLDGRGFKLVMDFGPLGYPSPAAHGHADALAVLLAVDGTYLLADAGTYAYHSHPKWRAYFRGTTAHNTVQIDGLDQSVMTGRFIWGRQAAAELIRFEDREDRWLIEAEQDGYMRLDDPVLHRRSVACSKATLAIRVEDTLECRGSHDVQLHWHLHEDAAVAIAATCATVTFRGRTIRLEMAAEGFELSCIRGSEDPLLGWRSPAFNVKLPIATLRFSGRIGGTSRIVTNIYADPSSN